MLTKYVRELDDATFQDGINRGARPVLVDFWAPWCPPCRAMNPTIEALARDFKVCKVNIDKNQPLAAHYNVSSVPTLLVFKGGQIVATRVGLTAEGVLRAELEKLRA